MLCDPSKKMELPFLACYDGNYRDCRTFKHVKRKENTFSFLGRNELQNYLAVVKKEILEESFPSRLNVVGISGSGKSYLTSALVYYLTWMIRNTCMGPKPKYRVVYIPTVLCFCANFVLFFRYALKIAFYSDYIDEDALKKCADEDSFRKFLMTAKSNIVFIIDQYNVLDCEEYGGNPEQKTRVKEFIELLSKSYSTVIVVSPTDKVNNNANRDSPFNSLDISEPLNHVSSCYPLYMYL